MVIQRRATSQVFLEIAVHSFFLRNIEKSAEMMEAVFSGEGEREEILSALNNTSLWWKCGQKERAKFPLTHHSPAAAGDAGMQPWKEKIREEIITEDGVNTDGELSPQDQNGLLSFPVEKEERV